MPSPVNRFQFTLIHGPNIQVPMQYFSLQHQTLLPSLVRSTIECCFCFGSISSFFSWVISPLFSSSILGTYPPGEFILQCTIFWLFVLFMGLSRQEYLPFPSPVDHVLSELSIVTCPSWVALHDMDHSFSGLDKAVVHVSNLISFLWLWFLFCLPSDG